MLSPTQRAIARQATLRRMSETVIAGQFKQTTDPETGNAARTVVTERYTGPAEVLYRSLVVSDREAAGQLVAAQSLVVKVPIDASLLHEGDEIEVTGSTADVSLIGRVYRVTGAPQSGKVTAHRYPVSELS